jgi:uncharacterized membrane-anchored protein YhcB (DUF1043 family)
MVDQHADSLDGFLETLEKRSRAARTISIVATVAVIAIGVVVLFFTIRAVTNEQKKLATVQQQVAAANNQLAKAKAELKQVNETRAVRYSDSYDEVLARYVPDKAKRDELLEEAAKSREKGSAKPKVYLQILNNGQRPQARAVSDVLVKNRVNVQGIEWVRVPVSGIDNTEVRYFREDYVDEAQRIVSLLQEAKVQNAKAVPVNLAAGTAQIEVWFSPNAFPAISEDTGRSKGLDSLALARQANDALFEFLQALKRPKDQYNATRKLQSIVALLERDKDAASYLQAAKLSSKDDDGFELRNGLEELRRTVASKGDTDLLNRINQTIVQNGP